jgi:hypothetical protein
VHGVVRDLSGNGTLELAQGLPLRATGNLEFTLAIDALTQPVESQHKIRWTLQAIDPKAP